jgi:hypothetical protein
MLGYPRAMRHNHISNVRTVEEEIRWLKDMGLNAEEKIVILELMMSTAMPEDREIMQEAIDAIAVENILLGSED